MAVFENEVQTFEVDMRCDKCGKGVMRPSGRQLLSKPPKFHHVCNWTSCAYETIYNVSFPYTETRTIV